MPSIYNSRLSNLYPQKNVYADDFILLQMYLHTSQHATKSNEC